MKDPKCPACKRELSGFYDCHRTFYKCTCGKEWKGYDPKKTTSKNPYRQANRMA